VPLLGLSASLLCDLLSVGLYLLPLNYTTSEIYTNPNQKEKKITFPPCPRPRPGRPCTSFCIEEKFYALKFFFPTLL